MRSEIYFFILYFVVGGVMPVAEYAGQFIRSGTFYTTLSYFAICGVLNIPPFWAYYRYLVPGFLFTKRYLAFLLALSGFLIAYDIYLRLITDGLLSRVPFLSSGVQQFALAAFERDGTQWIRLNASFTAMYLFAVAALAYMLRAQANERQLYALKEAQVQSELEYLKAQLNPHFFFNTLNNIYSLALDRSEMTAPIIDRLSALMAYTMYDTSVETVGLEQEIDFLRNYTDLERIRFPDSISITFNSEGDTSRCRIAPLLLIPFVENAFKHGVSNELEKGFVNIFVSVSSESLSLYVKNSIPLANKKTNGIGLTNVSKRLALAYPGRYTLSHGRSGDSYKVNLTIRLDG